MTISDWIMIIAVLAGPIVAVQLTRYLDDNKDKRERKAHIFKTLMATRSYNVSWDHVSALNRIDLEFDKSKRLEKNVIEAWKSYLDWLGNNNSLPPEQWGPKRIDLFVELLHAMATVLGYDFDKTHIKNSSYSPVAHGNLENEQQIIRTGIIKILNGQPIPMTIVDWPKSNN